MSKAYTDLNMNGNQILAILNATLTGYIDLGEISTPSNPSANIARFYCKDDGGTTKIYYRDSAGTETEMGGGVIPGSPATGELLVADASDEIDGLGSQGILGQYLKSNGAGSNPAWATLNIPDYWSRGGTTIYPTTSGDHVLINGTLALGTGTIGAATLNCQNTVTTASYTLANALVNFGGTTTGVALGCTCYGTSTSNLVVGLSGWCSATGSDTVTIAEANGLRYGIAVTNKNATVTNASVIHIVGGAAQGTVVNDIGLLIDTVDRGTSSSYSIKTNGGDVQFGGNIYNTAIKSGATQGGCSAAANEIWKTSGHASLPDNVLMIGV